jgi:hypothetical protein
MAIHVTGRHTQGRGLAAALALTVGLVAQPQAQAAPPVEARASWEAYVRATEARVTRERVSSTGFFARDAGADAAAVRRAALAGALVVDRWQTRSAHGREWDVPDAAIHHWVGTVFLPGVELPRLLERLQGVDVQKRQPDVLAARVLSREADGLSVFLRLRRSQIVTVTYDTEHRVRFLRFGPSRAASTTMATRITEIEAPGTTAERPLGPGEDRGFLWALNAWWRYEAVDGGVLVECESISLSRRPPFGLGAIAAPFVTRVARESMVRTLEALRTTFAGPRPPDFSARAGRL